MEKTEKNIETMKISLVENYEANDSCFIFDIVDDGKIVGTCQLRREARKSVTMPEGFESHVYYEIAEPFRGKGYASAALTLMLEQARLRNINPVLLSVAVMNDVSRHIIQKHGGKLLKTALDTLGTEYELYSISL